MFGFRSKTQRQAGQERARDEADNAAIGRVRTRARAGVGRFTEPMPDGSTAYAYRIRDSVASGIKGKDGQVRRRWFK
jgi:hypothetical protein